MRGDLRVCGAAHLAREVDEVEGILSERLEVVLERRVLDVKGLAQFLVLVDEVDHVGDAIVWEKVIRPVHDEEQLAR
jgi:hypothetical protein